MRVPTAAAKLTTLVLIALLSAVAWRAELEWHGWGGLVWAEYFHWAIPFGVGLFLIWLGLHCGIRPLRRRLLYLLCACLCGVIAYFLVLGCLQLHFVAGPTAMFLLLAPPWYPVVAYYAIVPVYVAIPVTLCLLSRAFGARIAAAGTLLSAGVFLSAYPFAIFLLAVTRFPEPDLAVHTIKTGYIIPLLVVGLGVPFVLPEGAGQRSRVAGGSQP